VRSLPILGFLAANALSASASAGSITVGAPLIPGDVSIYEGRHTIDHRDLSPDQLNGISRWLDQHESGWQGIVTPASSEPADLEVTVKHNDGSTTRMSIIARSGGGQYLRLTGPGTMAYRSLFGLFRSWAAIRTLSDQELAALRSQVSTN
jgi:hypothetical protein